MDLGKVSAANTPVRTAVAGLPARPAAAGPASGAKPDKLLQACEDFESLFLEQVFKEARQGATALSGDQPSFGRQVYESWQDEAFSKSMSTAGGIGLAQMLYRQLDGNTGKR